MLFSNDGRVLAGPTEIRAEPSAIEIQPPLEAQNTVQYIALVISGANQWRRGAVPGELLTEDGSKVTLHVELEAASGTRYVLASPTFGKDLMLSHVDPSAPPGAPDLPPSERFVRLWLSASPTVVAQQVRWSDITNK